MALKDDIIKNAGHHFHSLSHPLLPHPYYHRFLSWEHCYDEFGKVFSGIHTAITNADKDLLALHLATYLASWGMYRGSSFLLQVDYKVHVPVVELITEKNCVGGTIFKYRDLFGIEWSKLDDNKKANNLTLLFGSSDATFRYRDLFDIEWSNLGLNEKTKKLEQRFGLSGAISGYYDTIRNNVKGPVNSEVSRTLVTKVLMGTLGCVPAYDTYFKEGIKKANKEIKKANKVIKKANKVIKKATISSNFSKKSISALIDFYRDEDNKSDFDNVRATMTTRHGKKYPEMKFLDMGFWGY
jgi:hypothetical protein